MPVTINDFTYTNGNSGRTRVNAQGLIVGVDFSLTSNTIGTGPRTFVLTADLGVNRDWPVGSTLVAVAQAGSTGSLIGTVTSYVASTQTLVMEVASVTGSGTGTNWRIGSTMVRDLVGSYDFRDFDPITLAPKGGLFEGGSTNGHSPSVFLSPTTIGGNSIVPVNNDPTMGYAFEVTANTGTTAFSRLGINQYPLGTSIAADNVRSIYAKKINARYVSLRRAVGPEGITFDLDTGEVLTSGTGSGVRVGTFFVRNVGGGWYRFGWLASASSNPSDNDFQIGFGNEVSSAIGNTAIVTQIGEKVLLAYPSMYLGTNFDDSPIPTTTVSVTRAADQLSVGGANFSQFYNATKGTLVMELTPIAQAVGAVAGSLNDGTLSNSIRIQQKQSGTRSSIRKMATDGVTDVMAVNASTGNTLRSNGVDYTEVGALDGAIMLGVSSATLNNYLVVGNNEVITSSGNAGESYTQRAINGVLTGAHFGIGRFIIGRGVSVVNGASIGSVIVSTDGLAFRRVNIPGLTQQLNEITSNGTNQYVAVGNAGALYTSPDAETWTAQTSGTTSQLNGVHHFGGRYVAVGTSASRYSDNGTTWTTTTGLAMVAYDVYHNGTDLWVAVGGAGNVQRIYTSSDGITWSLAFSGAANSGDLGGVHFADGLWVAVGSTGTVVTSPDGVTWTNRTANSGTTSIINEVGFFSGKFYAVLQNTVLENSAANIVANVTWTARSPGGISSFLNGIATNGSRLLVCGSPGGIATSEDGTTFTSRTGNAAQLNGAAFGAGTYVVVGNAANGSGLIATVNPTTFEYQRRVSGVNSAITEVSFLAGAFYAASNGNLILRSTDGINWTTVATTAALGISNIFGFAFGGTTYVGVGTNNRVATSSDGISWSFNIVSGLTQVLNGSSFANGLFVAVGNAGTIITSPNGTTWTIRTSGTTAALYSVMYSTRDSQWYAVGDNGVILRSADAITWTSISNDATVGIFTAGALQANPLAGKFIPSVKNRVAITWTAGSGVKISINGATPVADPSVTMPVLTQYSVGMNGVSGQHWNSTIKLQKAYRVAVADSELQAMSRI